MKTKLLLMLVVVGLAAGVADANMLVNPSFEEGAFTNHTPDYWVHWYTSVAPIHTWTSGAAHSGSKYMRMFNWTAGAYSAYLGQIVPAVKEGKDYSFSVWAKNGDEDQTNLAAIWCDWRNSFNGWIDSDVVYIPITEPNWIEIDFGTFTAPEGTVSVAFWLVATRENGVNAICYDDVSMFGPDPNIDAGPDMISWDGETLSLTGTTSLAGYSTISWSADPAAGAVITGGDTLTPTVQVNPIIESGPATIANYSFENGLDNWDIISGDGHGTWNGAGYAPDDSGLKIYITPTDGIMCAYLDGVTGEEAGVLSQVLANNLLAANTTYTLTVDVANDGYDEEDVKYMVQLLAGGTVLAEDDNGHDLDTYGVWETSTVTYSTGAAPAQLGERLEIRLVAKAGTGNDMNFDNVHLTADPPFGTYVPDILTYKLTLDIDGKYDTMKIDAYPDACAATLGAGLREATDLVDEDCITNLADLAEMVKTWTDDNVLTEPTAKEDQGPGPEVVTYDFDDGTLQGWNNLEGATEDFVVWADIWARSGSSLVFEANFDDRDSDTDVKVLTSPAFKIIATSSVEVWSMGGTGAVDAPTWTNYSNLPAVATSNGFLGAALRRVSDGKYLLFSRRTYSGEYLGAYEALGWDTETIAAAVAGDNPNELYVVDIIDTFTGVWGWIAFDDITLIADFSDPRNPYPADGAYIHPSDELELSWTNMDPNIPGDPVFVDVWFGTDPNDYNDYNKVVDAVEAATSVMVNASTEGTHYWQVDSYIYGAEHINEPNTIEGDMWSFHAVTNTPPSVEAGEDMITWLGQAVQLDPNVVDDGVSELTYIWSAEPIDGIEVVFSNPNIEAPTALITVVPYSAARIANSGFEDPEYGDGGWGYLHPGWDDINNGGENLGIWNPADTGSYKAYGGEAPEGQNVGWAQNGTDGQTRGFAQVLAEKLAADTDYTLTAWVGCFDYWGLTDYKVQLLAGGSLLAEDHGIEGGIPDFDTFKLSTVTYDSTGVDPGLVGQNLEIRLLTVDYGEADLDDVQLTADPPFTPTGVQTVTLKLSVHDGIRSDEDTMTIDMYETACLAAIIGLGEEYDPGDFDVDCDTDIEDYAAIAEEWLVYSGLTEPIEKP